MHIGIVPYTADHEEHVRQFNTRLRAKPEPPQFPASHVPQWLPRQNSDRVYQEFALAVDEDSCVRGGYILKHQEFLLNGRACSAACYRLPISEAVVDPKYNAVGVRLLFDALRKQPRLFALGMGGFGRPLPQMLRAMHWNIAEVPFFFRVVHAGAFLRNVVILRTSRLRRVAFDLAALTGFGPLAVKAVHWTRPARRSPASVRSEQVESFGLWADELWERAKDHYPLIAVRNSGVLNLLYPQDAPRLTRLRVERDGRAIGWAVLLATPMSGHRQFGNMKVGTLVDCLADPADAIDVVACARDALEAIDVDLIVSNQSHAAWCDALRRCGFFNGPSNFLFAASPELAGEFQPFAKRLGTFHLNRGDGDGPIHL